MEHGQTELDIVLMSLVLHGEIVSHIVALEVVLALTALSLRDIIVVPPLVREGRRSHIRRGSSFPLLFLLFAALSLLPLEDEKENGSYDSVSSRRHSCSPYRSRGKKKSHKKRKLFSTSSSSSRCSSSSSSRE